MTSALIGPDLEPPSTSPASALSVEVVDIGEFEIDPAPLARLVGIVFETHGRTECEVSVALTTDDHIRDLNLRFRGIDEPTDVLTFPLSEPAGKLVGDIAISVPYAERQAAARGIPLDQELGYLAIHGALHLIGFDDETDDEREGMLREMQSMAALGGLPGDPEWSSILHGQDETSR